MLVVPIGQFIVIGVAVIAVAQLHQDAPCVQAGGVAAIPALGAVAGGVLDDAGGLGQSVALGGLVHIGVAVPTEAVAHHIPAGLADGRRRLGGALQALRHGIDGAGQAGAGEKPMQPPEADAAAILEHALGREVTAFRQAGGALGQGVLALRVAIGHRALAALLVIDDEVEREARTARPAGIGGIAAIAFKIADHGMRPSGREVT